MIRGSWFAGLYRRSGRIDGGELDYGFRRKERGKLWKNGRMTALEFYGD